MRIRCDGVKIFISLMIVLINTERKTNEKRNDRL